jgi:hypothetical protein
MLVNSKVLPCGYKVIPFIVNGEYNKQLNDQDAERSCEVLGLLKEECKGDRLEKNYTIDLRLDQMVVYSVLWDENNEKPVLTTGAHRMSEDCVRLFTRYYLFKDYRTETADGLFAKVDNFETDFFHKELVEDYYPFLFWSRDKSKGFFDKISKIKLFEEWRVYPEKIAITKPKNQQYIMYCGKGKGNPKLYINQLISSK